MSILSELGAYLKDNRAVKEFASSGSFPATGKINTVYVDKSIDKIYYWDGSTYAGIDAETLDGLNSTQFLRSDIAQTINGNFTINGALDFNAVSGRAITLTGDTTVDNADVSIYLGNAPSSYGYDITYEGTGSANTNALAITATNAGTPKEILRANQDGILQIGQLGTTISGNTVFHDGYHPNADKLTTARTISLSGDVTGTVSFDGSTNATITASVVDDSHNHIISNVDGLQSALDGKVSTNSNQVLHATDALSLTGNILYLNKADGSNENIDLSLYLDDTNLARIVSGTYDSGTQELVFTRDDNSEFRVDASMFFDDTNLVTSVAGKTGAVVLVKGDVGLGNVDNTADATKNVLSATKLTTARTISLSGDVSGSVSFDGSSNVTIPVVIADDSHNHTIANVDGLQTTLDGKLSVTGKATDSDKLDGLDSTQFVQTSGNQTIAGVKTFSSTISGSITGNAGTATTATTLQTARTISLSGDATGSVSFNGSANVTIPVVIADDSHNHIISNIDGLQTALDGKLSTTGKAADSNLLDGLDSTQFARTDVAETFNENVAFNKAVSVTGNISVSGTVDGRDIASDGTKLDNIGTFAEFQTAFESHYTI